MGYLQKIFGAFKANKTDPKPACIISFKDIEELKNLTLSYLETRGRLGAGFLDINRHIVSQKVPDPAKIDLVLDHKNIRDQLKRARSLLKDEGFIGYNRADEVWYLKKSPIRDLTNREKTFLRHQGFGPGWRKIDKKIDAIHWIHENFDPEQFENFCIAILTAHKVKVKVTEKRPVSGADGGFDGEGEYEIDGVMQKVAVQAKRYAPTRQVGEDQLKSFFGSLYDKDIRYGFFITTGTFSDRLKVVAENYFSKGTHIELIDQNFLIDIMLAKLDQPHGFGLHQTDYNLIYINEEILRKAARGS